jgi:16S rRNA (adenine1518-N6/adenine1519-N6)-dimethyltransferase
MIVQQKGCFSLEPLTSPRVLKELTARYGFTFTKSLGQNFLIDENILNKIIDGAEIGGDDNVLEIGPGVGTLTRAMAARGGMVAAVEIDRALLPILGETVGDYENVRIIQGDILKLDIRQLTLELFGGRPFKVVANLPYYITTPIIMRFLEEDLNFMSMVVMVQKEVGERMSAHPGTKDYGALTVAVQFYTHPRIVARVPARVFMPPPKVDSIVVALDKRREPAVDVSCPRLFFSIVKAAFAQRRKTLLNTIAASGLIRLDKESIKTEMIRLGIDPSRRGETLTLDEFALLSNGLEGCRCEATSP